MLTKEEIERFRAAMLQAHRCVEYTTEAAYILDALEKLPPERLIAHLAYFLQHFWGLPTIAESNDEKRIATKHARVMAKKLSAALAAKILPILQTRPPVEEAARELWMILSKYPRPQRDIALAIVRQQRLLVPYGEMPEPGAFAITEDHYELFRDVDKTKHADAWFLGQATTHPEYPSNFSYFAARILAVLQNQTPQKQTALLATALRSWQRASRAAGMARVVVTTATKPPDDPNDPSRKPN